MTCERKQLVPPPASSLPPVKQQHCLQWLLFVLFRSGCPKREYSFVGLAAFDTSKPPTIDHVPPSSSLSNATNRSRSYSLLPYRALLQLATNLEFVLNELSCSFDGWSETMLISTGVLVPERHRQQCPCDQKKAHNRSSFCLSMLKMDKRSSQTELLCELKYHKGGHRWRRISKATLNRR